MKITCIADTHRQHRDVKLKKGDILIFAGDIDCWGPYAKKITEDFADWIAQQPFKYKIIIGGNHDWWLDIHGANYIRKFYFNQKNMFYLENSSCNIEGIKFWGSPITPVFNNWFFMAKRGDKIAKIWNKIPKDTDIVITHGPPIKILDTNLKGEHVGCRDLLQKIKEIKPAFHVFGHTHLNGGKTIDRAGTIFINCSILDEEYNITNKPAIFTYDN